MYHLPLLPGYDPNVNVRSSMPAKTPGGTSFAAALSEAEENGYEGTYFPSEETEDSFTADGFIPSSSPEDSRLGSRSDNEGSRLGVPLQRQRSKSNTENRIAEVIFFAYGVVVFFGLQEAQERAIIDDINTAGILLRRFEEDMWEVEECHYTVRPLILTSSRASNSPDSMIPT